MIDETFCVVDNGLFTELAVRLARETSKPVLYAVQWEAEFPLINDRFIGAGLENVTRIEDPYLNRVVDETDTYVFPDIFHAGKQQLLERSGKSVWGSREGDAFETKRVWFRKLQSEMEMPLPEYRIIEGFDNLASFLKDHGHCFVKTTSKIRGTMETHEFFDFEQDEYWLWDLKMRLASLRDLVLFVVEEPIETEFETGIDTYCIDGKFPKTPMQGIEVKGKLILCSAQTQSPTPKALDDALTTLAPALEGVRYRNFLSAEFRGDILTDLCARCPNPGIGVEMEMVSNLPDIIRAGARGELIEPEYEFEFGIQAAIFHDHEDELPKQFRIPEDLRRWVKLMEFCKVGDLYQILPRRPFGHKIGWLLGVGDSIEAASEHLYDNAEALKDHPWDIKLDALADAVHQAQKAEKAGFEFTDQPVPVPAAVLEDG
jgi:hypothetical protein